MYFKDLQKYMDKVVIDQNNQPIPDFEGYSANEMELIMDYPFEESSPLKLKKLSDSDYERIPILNQIKYIAKLIDEAGEIKLTNKGFIPTKMVADIYQQGLLKDEAIESGITKLYKETDANTLHLSMILLYISGLTKKRNGKLSLTKSSSKTLQDDSRLLQLIITTFGKKFNWAYFDGYGDNKIGQLGFGFSLILLSKYGKEKRLDSFYSNKYIKAFPSLLNNLVHTYGTLEDYVNRCYSIRTFERFLNYFGLIEIQNEGTGVNIKTYIKKTSLFDKLIVCSPHKKR